MRVPAHHLRALRGERLPWLLPPLVVVALLAPMLFTQRSFYEDWTNHLWLVWNQSEAIRRGGAPTLWTHTDYLGVYYPQFLFYGGTLFGLAGYVAAVLGGHPTPAFLLFFALAFGAAYGGWSWLAHQAGLRGWAAQLPGLVHVTASAYVSIAYARSDWPEFVALSMLPLVAASGWWLLRAPRWRAWPVAALVASLVLLTGSHNLSLVWGTTFLLAISAVVAVALGGGGLAAIGVRRIAAVAGMAVTAAAVNGWFLVPDLTWSSRIAKPGDVGGYDFFNTARLIFSPAPLSPDLARVSNPSEAATTWPREYVQLPVLALVWALVAAGGTLRRRGPWRRLLVGVLGLMALLLVLVLRGDPAVGAPGRWLWEELPHFLRYTQFALRLHGLLVPLVAGLVLLGLLATRTWPARRRGAAVAVLGVVCVYMAGVATWQAWVTPNSVYADRSQLFDGAVTATPESWGDTGNYRDYASRGIAVPRSRSLRLDPEAAARVLPGDPGAVPAGGGPIGTNIAASPDMVELRGLEPLGRLAPREDPEGFNPVGLMVVRRAVGEPSAGPLGWSVRRRASTPMVAGALVSLGGAGVILALAAREIRRRRR